MLVKLQLPCCNPFWFTIIKQPVTVHNHPFQPYTYIIYLYLYKWVQGVTKWRTTCFDGPLGLKCWTMKVMFIEDPGWRSWRGLVLDGAGGLTVSLWSKMQEMWTELLTEIEAMTKSLCTCAAYVRSRSTTACAACACAEQLQGKPRATGVATQRFCLRGLQWTQCARLAAGTGGTRMGTLMAVITNGGCVCINIYNIYIYVVDIMINYQIVVDEWYLMFSKRFIFIIVWLFRDYQSSHTWLLSVIGTWRWVISSRLGDDP